MGKGLGKGINALFTSSVADIDQFEKIEEVFIRDIRPNPYQPRKVFDINAINELAASIQEHGIIQPIILRKAIKGYEIVAGERRFRAAKEIGLKKVPAVIRSLAENEMMEIALLENLQREDLNAIEEALAYQSLLDKLSITQEVLAKKVGKSRPHIANTLRLLTLPADVQQMVSADTLSMGHARALIGLKDKTKMYNLIEAVQEHQLNVRQLEKLIQDANTQPQNVSRETKEKVIKDKFILSQEQRLTEAFGTQVKISQGKNKGKIEIVFTDATDCNRILDLLMVAQEK